MKITAEVKKVDIEKLYEIVSFRIRNNPFNSNVSEIASAANNGYTQAIIDVLRDIESLAANK